MSVDQSPSGKGQAVLPAPGPWASGPAEILHFATQLIASDEDSSRRIGMILTDNAVELSLKVYIGLPARANGLKLSRREAEEAGASFGSALDAVEKWAPTALEGIDLSDLEWYHRLRNMLYHEGNGLTVELLKAHAFLALARSLYTRLFGPLPDGVSANAVATPSTDFLEEWALLFQENPDLDGRNGPNRVRMLTPDIRASFSRLNDLRKRVAHGAATASVDDREELIHLRAQLLSTGKAPK